ncbi:MAG TPA: choice-of-anchor tandem repeat GloVer-containing protein [Candidatus Cybelea sp.]|nr:choice-of-anchor tandem repeat GloVer-containing protein [Candidatus Cybelea sp.]
MTGFTRWMCVAIASVVLCGCALALPGTVTTGAARVRQSVAKLAPIYSFRGSPDGADPIAAMVAPTVGSWTLLGVTYLGGNDNNGLLFGLTETSDGIWSEQVLYKFGGTSHQDGSHPNFVFINPKRRNALDVIVTTYAGGSSNNGTLIELEPSSKGTWSERFVYSFGGAPDGASPQGLLDEDKRGNLYGTTSTGGTGGSGTVYKMAPTASGYAESVLYNFQDGADGGVPYGGVILGQKGVLYGTTVTGGSYAAGTVFALVPSSSGYTERVLYGFAGYPDGASPYSGLCLDAHGDLFGTTTNGGTANRGTVFEIIQTSTGTEERPLWSFHNTGAGSNPYGGVLVSANGTIVGTTYSGGSRGLGTIFTLEPMHSTYVEKDESFTGADGADPYAAPFLDRAANLYATASAGGKLKKGTVVRGGLFHPHCRTTE